MFRRGTKRPRFSLGGHPIFEHDDSSNHSGLGIADYEEDSSSQQHSLSTNSSDAYASFNQMMLDRPRRVQKPQTKIHNEDNTNLNACLDYLLRTLSRKDKQGFFQYPVTDQFAPGYSQIITRPMDFSTMKKKIKHDEYANVLDFRSDFELMCDNAMKYNRPDTVYWQAAKKLLAIGTKFMHKDKLISYRRSVECFSRLTEREFGFRIDSLNHSNDEHISATNEQIDLMNYDNNNHQSTVNQNETNIQRKPKLILKLPKFCDKVSTAVPEEQEEDELPVEEILSHAQQAAQCAREKLNLRGPTTYCTLAYERVNSLTSLRFVNQDDFSHEVVNLGETSHLPPNDNDINSVAKSFLENGPFSSNPSQSDSTFASLTQEELDLLIHTYGSEYSAQYAVSLMDYVKDAGELALAYVDRFLSVLTNGEHDNFIMKKREKQTKNSNTEDKILETVSTNTEASSNDSMLILPPDQLKSEKDIDSNQTIVYQQNDIKSEDNSSLFLPLNQTQYDSLSQTSNQQQQSINEYELAEKDLFNLSDMTQISNGNEQMIPSDNLPHNYDMVHPNESTFDTM